jgi:predicted O-methyltransferase YrrM
VCVVEAVSARAASLFDRIDFLHVDGSHSVVSAVEDVILYVQKVRSGGIVLLDDIGWPTTQAAFEVARTLCDQVMLLDRFEGRDNCAVLRRR